MNHSSFNEWFDSFGTTGPNPGELTSLANYFCSRNDNDPVSQLFSTNATALPTIENASVVSWKGVSVQWFLQHFMNVPPVARLAEFGCPMWFVRNHCIPLLLPRLPPGDSCCLIDAVGALKGDDCVAKPSIFVSYTGGYQLSLFAELAKDLEGNFMWCDMFCVDQVAWGRQSADFKDGFMHRLQENVAAIGHTVLLLNRWDRLMDALGMIWVLWEIFATVEAAATLDVLLSDEQHEKFLFDGLATTHGIRSIFASLADIDARRAAARYPEDTARILRLMEEVKGVTRVNEAVVRRMRQWLVQTGAEIYGEAIDVIGEAADGEDEEIDAIKMCHNMARLYALLGDFVEAERLQRKVVAGFLRIVGQEHEATLTGQNALAGMLREQGRKLTEAGDLYRLVLEKRRSLHGEEALDTLTSANNFGNLLMVERKFSEAQGVYEQALQNIPSHQQSEEESWFVLRKSLLSNLGVALSEQQEYEAAEEHLAEVLRIAELRLGSRHPESVRAVGNIASLAERKGDSARAEELFRANQTTQRKLFGESNHQTLHTMHCLSMTLFKLEKYEEAEILSRETFRKRAVVLGRDHTDTVKSGDLLESIQLTRS